MLPRSHVPVAAQSPSPYWPAPESPRHEATASHASSSPVEPYAPWPAPSNGRDAPAGPAQQYTPAPYPPPVQYPPAQYPPPVQPLPAMEQPSASPYAPHATPQASPPRKGLPTPVVVIFGILAAGVVGLVLLLGIGAAVGTRATPTPTVRPTMSAVATAKPAAATAKPAPSPTPTPLPSPTPIPTPTRVPVSLANGTDVTPPAPGPAGLGKLTIANGTSRDAVAKLVTGTEDPKTWQTQRFVYVKANDTVVMAGIPVGTYRLAFMSGVDWDADARKFLREVSASQFEETFEFKEEQTERGTRFSTWEVSLNPVAGGTGKTSTLPEGAFGPE